MRMSNILVIICGNICEICNYMEELTIVLLLILGSICFFYSLHIRDFLNPLACFLYPIIGSFLFYYFLYMNEQVLSDNTYIAFILGVGGYCLGYGLTEGIIPHSIFHSYTKNSLKVARIIENVYLLIGILAFLGGAYIFFLRGLENVGGNFFVSVRALAVQGKFKNIFVTYGSVFLFIITMWFYYRLKVQGEKCLKNITYILLVCNFGIAIFNLAKTDVLITILACGYISYSAYKYNPELTLSKPNILSTAFLALLMVTIFFGAISWARGAHSWTVGFIDKDFVLYKYLGYPLVAFDKYIVEHPFSGYGYNSSGGLGKLYAILFDGGESFPSFGAPPNEFNVYSFLYDPYIDFGTWGCGIILFVIGAFSSLVFQLSKKIGGFFTIFYSSYLFAIVMAFFDYQFANTQYFWNALLLFILWVYSRKTFKFSGIGKFHYLC